MLKIQNQILQEILLWLPIFLPWSVSLYRLLTYKLKEEGSNFYKKRKKVQISICKILKLFMNMLRSVQSKSIYELNVHIILVLKPECVEIIGICGRIKYFLMKTCLLGLLIVVYIETDRYEEVQTRTNFEIPENVHINIPRGSNIFTRPTVT